MGVGPPWRPLPLSQVCLSSHCVLVESGPDVPRLALGHWNAGGTVWPLTARWCVRLGHGANPSFDPGKWELLRHQAELQFLRAGPAAGKVEPLCEWEATAWAGRRLVAPGAWARRAGGRQCGRASWRVRRWGWRSWALREGGAQGDPPAPSWAIPGPCRSGPSSLPGRRRAVERG